MSVTTAPDAERTGPRTALVEGGWLVLLAIVLVALNLRPAVTSLGTLLDQIHASLHLSGLLAGILTTLPVLCFATFGALTPRLARRFGPHRVLAVATGVLTAGLLARAVTDTTWVFVGTSAFALAGIACANILLPVLVKQHFPARVGLMTGVYTMALTLGSSLAAAATVPLAHALGGWHVGLGIWAAAAAVAFVPWVLLHRRDAGPADGADAGAVPAVRPSRTSVGWALALYFGAQSLNAYVIMGWLPQLFRDAGFSAGTAGLMVAAIMAFGIPVALIMPTLAARRPDQRWIVFALTACYLIGYAGLLVAPRAGAWAWVVALALGQGAFPLALALIGLRSRTAAGTVALSAFAQSAGYLFAAAGPLLVGVLYTSTGGWTLPLLVLIGVIVLQGVVGTVAARPRYLEDGGRSVPNCRYLITLRPPGAVVGSQRVEIWTP